MRGVLLGCHAGDCWNCAVFTRVIAKSRFIDFRLKMTGVAGWLRPFFASDLHSSEGSDRLLIVERLVIPLEGVGRDRACVVPSRSTCINSTALKESSLPAQAGFSFGAPLVWRIFYGQTSISAHKLQKIYPVRSLWCCGRLAAR